MWRTVVELLLWPFIEYGLHVILHRINDHTHRLHHANLTPEESYFTVALLALAGFHGLALGAAGYFAVHYCVHRAPHLCPALAKHHLDHHRHPGTNFGVTTTFIDRVTGTDYRVRAV